MIGAAEIAALGVRLADRAGPSPPPAYDGRIDAPLDPRDGDLLVHAKHQALLRAYQARYVLLPDEPEDGSILARLARHYDENRLAELSDIRPQLEQELIAPRLAAVRPHRPRLEAYVAHLLPELEAATENPFIAFLEDHPQREAHYRNFLIQSSSDLLAEASASALGVIGEFGAPQSALFRILIDEFGYGAHGRKHSVLYRHVMAGFGLSEEYNAYWPWFDTVSLELHNTIHFLFQNPGRLFLQVGFLLHAEAAYRKSTEFHHRHLRRFHPEIDARYFGEHAHIDRHHTAMVVDEVARPLAARYGDEVGREIVRGAELTRQVFEASGDHALALGRAFDAAAGAGQATFAAPDLAAPLGRAVSPTMATDLSGMIQVGGLGLVTPAAFAAFPCGAIGRLHTPEAAA